MLFSLAQVEKVAQGKPVASILVHYEGREEPVRYPWENRKQIRWGNVRRVRLDFANAKQIYVGNGDHGTRPGFRIKPH